MYCPETEENLEIVKNWTKFHNNHRISFSDNAYDSDKNYHSHAKNVGTEYVKITFEQFKKYVMKKTIETPQEIEYKIKAKDAQSIIDIACDGWKSDLAAKWAKNIVLGEEVVIPEEFYKKMRKACTGPQNELFDKIFGDGNLKWDDLEYGQAIALDKSEISYDEKLLLKTYDGWVSLKDPVNTWDKEQKFKGTIVTPKFTY